jgi:hypothetical protein
MTIVAAVASISPAVAGTIWLDGSDGLSNQHLFAIDSHNTLTVTAQGISPINRRWSHVQVGQYQDGLGVTSLNPLKTGVDGEEGDEMLHFAFTDQFKLQGVIFSNVQHQDDVKIFTNNVFTNIHDLGRATPLGNERVLLNIDDVEILGFGLMAYGANDDWKVIGVRGYTIPTPTAAAAGLVGLIALATRRRTKLLTQQA